MPEATTPYSTIKAYCQDEVMDTTTDFWDATAWLREINRVTKDILLEIKNCKAFSLCDLLVDSVDITGDDSGSYNWYTAITGASKTYYTWIKVTVNDYENEIDFISLINWQHATTGFIATSKQLGVFTFGKNQLMYTRPKWGAADTIHFWFVKSPTAMSADAHFPDVDETLIELYPIGTGIRWARMKGDYKMVQSLRQEWQYWVRKLIRPYSASKLIRMKTTKSY